MFRPSRSLFWSLTGSIVAVLLLTAVFQILLAIIVVEPIIQRRLQSRAEELADAAAEGLAVAIEREGPEAVAQVLMRYQRLAEGVVLAFERVDGRRILPGPPGRGPRHGRFDRPRMRDPGPPVGDDSEVLARRNIEVHGGDAGELLVLRRGRRLALTAWLPLRWMLLFPASLIAAALGGMWIFRRLQRRIAELEAQARAVGEGDLSARIEAPGDDELGQLARQLNVMTGNLSAARDRVEAVESERGRMLADITHELSTPLTSVRGYAETLLDGRVSIDDAQRERYLGDILHASERMGLLIDDLLDLARLEAGAHELEFERLDLAALVAHSVLRHEPAFQSAGLAIGVVSPPGTVPVLADGRRMEQVVDNLLANALRHVPAGGRVEISVRVEARMARLEVADDGPGFAEDSLAHLFERFYRGDASRTTPGSGLGLAIVREIVARHGGSVEASNRAQRGALLTVSLPLAD